MDLVGLIVNMALERIFDDTRSQVLPRLGQLDDKIDLIGETIGQTRVGKLKSGLEYLSKGSIDKACDVLLELDNEEPHGAVTKLAEAAALQRAGEQREAARHVAEALMQNPFVAPDAAVRLHHLLAFRPTPTRTDWEACFDRRPTGGPGKPSRPVVEYLHDAVRGQAIVTAIAAGYSPLEETGHVAVAWRRAAIWDPHSRMPGEQVVTIFDLASGDCLWSRMTNEELLSATPRYVVLRSDRKPWVFRLVNPRTLSEPLMAQPYFEAMFWPGWDHSSRGVKGTLGGDARTTVAEDVGAVYQYMHNGGKPTIGRRPRPLPDHLDGTGERMERHLEFASEGALVMPMFTGAIKAHVHATNNYRCNTSNGSHRFSISAEVRATADARKSLELLAEVILDMTEGVASGDVAFADTLIDYYLHEKEADVRRGESTYDYLAFTFWGWLRKAKTSVPEDQRRAAVGIAQSWSRHHLSGRANVMSVAAYIGIPSNTPTTEWRKPATKEELWGMWALVCGLVQVVGGDTSTFLARLASGGE